MMHSHQHRPPWPVPPRRRAWLAAAVMALSACGPSKRERTATAPVLPIASVTSTPAADLCAEPIELCGQRLAGDSAELSCVNTGAVEFSRLKCFPKLRKLTVDEQGWYALATADDTSLGRLTDVTVKLATPFDEALPIEPFEGTIQPLYYPPSLDTVALGRLHGLQRLNVEWLFLKDLSPLSNLTELRELHVRGRDRLPSLERLTKLQSLSIEAEQDDVSSYAALTELRELTLSSKHPSACTVLASMVNLERLKMSAELLPCPALSRLKKLRSLELEGSIFSFDAIALDLTSLGGLPDLQELVVRAQPKSLRGLDGLVHLRRLTIRLPEEPAAGATAMKQLEPLTQLADLALVVNGDVSLQPLAQLPITTADLRGHVSKRLRFEEVKHLSRVRDLTWMGDGEARHLAALPELRKLHWTGSADWSQPPPLPHLKSLKTHSGDDLSWLASYPNLQQLAIVATATDASIISKLTALEQLHIYAKISDLSALRSLVKLRKLTLIDYDGSLSWLKGFTALRSLELSSAAPQLGTLPADLQLDKLSANRLKFARFSELAPFRARTVVLEADYGTPPIQNSEVVGRVRGLQYLAIQGGSATSLKPFAGLTSLEGLLIPSMPVTSAAPLRGLTKLRVLDIGGTKLDSAVPLAHLQQLRYLSLSGTSVRDYRPLRNLQHLRVLFIDKTPGSDLRPLSGLRSLWFLNADGTRVEDIAPLAGLSFLRVLSLENTRVFDFSPVLSLPLGIVAGDVSGTPCPARERLMVYFPDELKILPARCDDEDEFED